MEWVFPAFLAAAAASFGGTRLVLNELQRRAILDRPNQRSSHDRPIPRGGGIAVMAVILICWVAPALASPVTAALLTGACALAILSWLDDLRSLGIAIRLGAQFVAAGAGLIFLHGEGLLLQGLVPEWLDRAVTLVLWVWFVNLFNFMDGIDGIAAVETVIIAAGLALLGLAAPALAPDLWLALSLAAAALGFLRWNWQPAKVFLGDVGSIPLGFLLGGLLILSAMKGAWPTALILPLYFLADATLTLFRRALKREPVWQAHRQHCYQQAVQSGKSHAAVSIAVALAGLGLIGLSYLSIGQPTLAIAGALALVGGLMIWMAR